MTYDIAEARRDAQRWHITNGRRRRSYLRRCAEAGLTPLSRDRVNAISLMAAAGLSTLTSTQVWS